MAAGSCGSTLHLRRSLRRGFLASMLSMNLREAPLAAHPSTRAPSPEVRRKSNLRSPAQPNHARPGRSVADLSKNRGFHREAREGREEGSSWRSSRISRQKPSRCRSRYSTFRHGGPAERGLGGGISWGCEQGRGAQRMRFHPSAAQQRIASTASAATT
jgi:hypothetical protein